ncbi:hypothetical protein OPT61_g4575 [Boeremia exigua]|uniref:Uncharacterized protein n=1 Tax=Boeremia exigua TaxID=749465 RepID=A0ACC2IDK9_9PLEO|nr:hypothetical protein OPT61_g4575 [Boeremia exigua]
MSAGAETKFLASKLGSIIRSTTDEQLNATYSVKLITPVELYRCLAELGEISAECVATAPGNQYSDSTSCNPDSTHQPVKAVKRVAGVKRRGNCFIWKPEGLLIHTRDEAENRTYDLYVPSGSFNPFPGMIRTACHIPGNTASTISVLQVQRWLSRCNSSHKNCGTIGSDVSLPTRLIDVESGLRLVETRGMHGRYVCLSHCWGSQATNTTDQTFKVTRGSLNSCITGIDFNILPRTFTDAITFTRKLGLKYLWIDSLCIIQDDENDWRHEAGLMASIYENATLTLGATASTSDAGGLFRSNSPIHDPVSLHGKTHKGKDYIVFARQQLPHYLHDEPLFQRAWIFQERYLSPRFLHFGSNELIWECREGMDCECNENEQLGSKESDSVGYYNAHKSYYIKAFTATPFKVQVYWRDIVDAYTGLALSHAKDTLPALSGLAKKFIGLRTGDEYLAGLWYNSFAEDLVWAVGLLSSSKQKSGLRSRPKQWRAPTWSWASVDSAVRTRGAAYYHGEDHKSSHISCIDVLAVHCVPAGDDITGELLSGYAILKGPIMAGYFRFRPQQYRTHFMAKGGVEAEFNPDYRFDVYDEHRVQDGDRIFCLQILRDGRKIGQPTDEFLVLRKKRGTVGTFERIGQMFLGVNGGDFHRMFDSRREECAITIV